jgi:hypothetical protein
MEILNQETEDDSDGLEFQDLSDLIDQTQVPERLRNKRIEHKIIAVGPSGTPQVTIISIPQKFVGDYFNHLFKGVTSTVNAAPVVETVIGLDES